MHSFHFLARLYFRFGRFRRSRIELLGELQVFSCEFVSLVAKFVCASMICFAVGDCCNGVSMRLMIV